MQAERLRSLLGQAAKNNFAGIDEFSFQKLGRLATKAAKDIDDPDFSRWFGELGFADSLESIDKTMLVARGLRICRQLFGAEIYPCLPQPGEGSGLTAPTQSLNGIGPVLAERLSQRKICNIYDLIWNLPSRYFDIRQCSPLAEALKAKEVKDGLENTGVGPPVALVATVFKCALCS